MRNSSILNKYFKKAYHSKFYLWLLNKGIARFIPFNSPHKFKIESLSKNAIEIRLPYIRKNLNHLKGIHACALATLCELTTGLLIISRIDPAKYRIIMKKIEIDYGYQAKMDVKAKFTLEESEIEKLIGSLKSEAVEYTAGVEVRDSEGISICDARIYWHIKSWDLVKTKV